MYMSACLQYIDTSWRRADMPLACNRKVCASLPRVHLGHDPVYRCAFRRHRKQIARALVYVYEPIDGMPYTR